MKTVPLNGGTVPLRTSKNPVLGVFRHHCGEIATVHQPQGTKKAHLRYLICDKCKCDQSSGDEYQAKIRANMQPNIEALLAAEGEPVSVKLTENTVTEIEPETNSDAVLDQNQLVEKLDEMTEQVAVTEQPTATPSNVVAEVVEQLAPEPKPQPINNTPQKAANDPIKPLKLVLSAIGGGVVGCLLALAR
ncbi:MULTISPECIES: hypothetical protein [Pseudoalteromonas]|uniref:hypothetical protein n=1 Tax=Pseudoalteromonas TaxID=53246 RepID=UPI00029A7360|nr:MULTISPECIES: hypothetical protein [Pseudoalteromonas]TMN44845.1 hypothetical protein CWC03_03110 [Pseudoalteromonas sp. S2755]